MWWFCCGYSEITSGDDDEAERPNARLLEQPESTDAISEKPTKFIFIGDTNCGKTSIIKKMGSNRFNESEISTVAVDFKIVYGEIGDNIHKLMLWDTSGQERFVQIAEGLYHNTDCFIIVYDLTNAKTCKNIKRWLQRIDKTLGHGDVRPYRIVVGNKMDLGERKLDPNDLEEIVGGVDHYVETSAKTGDNLDQLLKRMILVADAKNQK
jgi:small GTP-binding protein